MRITAAEGERSRWRDRMPTHHRKPAAEALHPEGVDAAAMKWVQLPRQLRWPVRRWNVGLTGRRSAVRTISGLPGVTQTAAERPNVEVFPTRRNHRRKVVVPVMVRRLFFAFFQKGSGMSRSWMGLLLCLKMCSTQDVVASKERAKTSKKP